jgi:hypothetical protein
VWHESIGLLSAATASSPRVPGNAFEGRAHAVEHHLWCVTPLEVACRGLLPRPAGLATPSLGERRSARPGYGRTSSAITHLSPARDASPKRGAHARHATGGYEEAHDILFGVTRRAVLVGTTFDRGDCSLRPTAQHLCAGSLAELPLLFRPTLSGPPSSRKKELRDT